MKIVHSREQLPTANDLVPVGFAQRTLVIARHGDSFYFDFGSVDLRDDCWWIDLKEGSPSQPAPVIEDTRQVEI